MKNLFTALGSRLGQTAAQAKNAFYLMGGSEEESLRAEIRFGHHLTEAFLARVPLVEENATTRFVDQIGRWLAGQPNQKRLAYSFEVTAERSVTALGLPGGAVFLSWPLVQICDGERDEIAFLLGHEMGHIALRHAVDRIVQDAALSLLLRQSTAQRAVAAWLNKTGQQLIGGAYAGTEELEADAFAAKLISKAGADGSAAERVLEKLARSAQESRFRSNWLNGHPLAAERIAQMRAIVQKGC